MHHVYNSGKNTHRINVQHYFGRIILYLVIAELPKGRVASALDFGTGPAIVTSLCTSSKVENIVCTDFAEVNRTEINKWLSGDRDAHDWTPYGDFFSSLEGCTYVFTIVQVRVQVFVYVFEPPSLNTWKYNFLC